LPIFNNIASKDLSFDAKPIFAFMGLGMLVGIVAGIYPAFYLSSFKPIAVLKGKHTTRFKNFSLRSRLVVFQFTISVVLFIGTIVVYQQMHYIQNIDLGFGKEMIIPISTSLVLGSIEQ